MLVPLPNQGSVGERSKPGREREDDVSLIPFLGVACDTAKRTTDATTPSRDATPDMQKRPAFP